jgi:hypothetical protein
VLRAVGLDRHRDVESRGGLGLGAPPQLGEINTAYAGERYGLAQHSFAPSQLHAPLRTKCGRHLDDVGAGAVLATLPQCKRARRGGEHEHGGDDDREASASAHTPNVPISGVQDRDPQVRVHDSAQEMGADV